MRTIQFDNGRAEVHAAHAHVFTVGESPVVTYRTAEGRWSPFKAEYGSDHRQITAISSEDAAARAGATASFIRQVEASAKSALLDARRANESRAEAGRLAWRNMSQSERDAMNDYAMKTEGHTID
jgi:hypothetical protein